MSAKSSDDVGSSDVSPLNKAKKNGNKLKIVMEEDDFDMDEFKATLSYSLGKEKKESRSSSSERDSSHSIDKKTPQKESDESARIKQFLRAEGYDDRKARNKRCKAIAQAAFDAGFVPIPLWDKKPRSCAWQTTTRDTCIDKCRKTNRNNIGIRTGQDGGIFVVDVDKKKNGVIYWEQLIAKHPKLNTRIHRTGGGGLHVIFKWNERLSIFPSDACVVKDEKGEYTIGIDIKNERGQIVYIGSVHESGKPYELISETKEIVDMPDWLFEFLKSNKKDSQSKTKSSNESKGSPFEGEPISIDVLRKLAMKLNLKKMNSRVEWLKRVWAIRDGSNTDEGLQIAHDVMKQSPDHYKPKELDKAWNEKSTGKITVASLFHWFKEECIEEYGEKDGLKVYQMWKTKNVSPKITPKIREEAKEVKEESKAETKPARVPMHDAEVKEAFDWDDIKDLPSGYTMIKKGTKCKVTKMKAMAGELIPYMNRTFCVLMHGAKPTYTEKTTVRGEVVFDHRNQGGFKARMQGYDLECWIFDKKTKKSKLTKVNVGDLWLNHSDHLRFRRIEFNPDPKDEHRDIFNLYCPPLFEVKENERKYDTPEGIEEITKPYLDHIEHEWCRGDKVKFNYVIKWMARKVQFPWLKNETALVVKGEEGSGKNVITDKFTACFGKHGKTISNDTNALGKFNSSVMLATLVLVFNEAIWAGDKKQVGTMKALLTDLTLMIEAKFMDAYQIKNLIDFIYLSNEDWIIPAGNGTRRFFVTETANTYAERTPETSAYFTKLHAVPVWAIYKKLKSIDVKGFDSRDVPKTKELRDQKVASMDGFTSWVYSTLQEDNLYPGIKYGDEKAGQSRVYKSFCWSVKDDKGYKMKKEPFWKKMKEIFGTSLKLYKAREEDGSRPLCVKTPKIKTARVMFSKYMKDEEFDFTRGGEDDDDEQQEQNSE